MSPEKSSAIYIFFSLLQKGIIFLLIPVMAFFVPPLAMGKITLLITMVNLLSVYLTVCLYGAGSVFTYKIGDRCEVDQLWGNIFIASHLCAVFIAVGLLYLYPFISPIFFKGFSHDEYMITIMISFCYSMYLQQQAYYQSNKKVMSFCINGLSFSVVNMIFIALFVVFLRLGYRGYFDGYLLTVLLFYILSVIYSVKKYLFKINWRLISKCFRYSLPLLPHTTFGFLLAYTDRIFISNYLDYRSLGFYGVVTQFALVFSIAITAFNNAVSPFYFESIKKSCFKNLENFIMFSVFVFSSMLLLFASFSYEIIYIFTKGLYHEYWYFLPIFVVMYLFNFGYVLFVNAIFYYNSFKVSTVTFFGAGLNVLLNFLWIVKYGMIGSVYASVFASLFSMVVAFIVYRKYEAPIIPIKKLSLLFLYVIVVVAAICLSQIYLGSLYLKVGVSVVGSTIGLWVMYVLFNKAFIMDEYSNKVESFLSVCFKRRGLCSD